MQYGGDTTIRRIVGVVGGVRSFPGREPGAGIYLPSAQTPAGMTRAFSSWFPTHVVIRTAGDPEALRDQMARVIEDADARVPVGRVRTMDEVLGASLAFQRFLMVLLVAFAALAMLLAAVGLYGVMSELVAQRTREIGLRMALGAVPGDVLRLVVGRGMALASAGAALGLLGAVLSSRLLTAELYEVRPADPAVLASVTALLLGVALFACWVPARRAMRVDPMEALRSE